MGIRYYLSIFPMEALIASQLEPKQFGTYMATGSKKGSSEQVIFCELSGEFGTDFDWDYAHEKCVPHSYGDPKHSVYLGVYRVLERVPTDKLASMFLVTRDGRTLELSRSEPAALETSSRGYHVFHELCPVSPVIVSKLGPGEFAEYVTDDRHKIYMPHIIFADLKVIDIDNPEKTGNIGSIYHRKIPHLMECIASVTSEEDKFNKTLTRTNIESFSFQSIDRGFYASDGTATAFYPMPTSEEIKQIDYDWGRSALIL